ncbi:MAG: hypothetical protein IPP53_17945 [Bacteroidetes bacterium]|nr:hypothetical protein [Bacteroidota bacterium]
MYIEDANGCITTENITLIDSTNNGDIAITDYYVEDVTITVISTGSVNYTIAGMKQVGK